MDDPSIARAPAAVSQNIDKIVQVESKALQPRSRSEALTGADLDVVALLWGRNEGFSPAATRLPRHCIGPFFLDPNNMPAIVLLNWGTVMAVIIH